MRRIGVFVCHCGTNIASTVDVKTVAETLGKEPSVVFATDYPYMCSEAGQNIIKDAIKEYKLEGVVVCSCSPRMHEATFRKAVAAAGLNPYLLEVANIREQCSWIHKDIEAGTAKAIVLGRAAIAKVLLNTPLIAGESPVTKRALVIGGGIAGIQTALDIAEAGYPVDIVEKQPTIGGKMTQIDKTFPTLDCSSCILTPKMVECAQNENITIYSYSEVEAVTGFVGNFTVKIRRKARFVDETKCTGCGVCTEKCPVKNVPNEYNLGMNNRHAAYIPFAQAIPNVPVIDREHCLKFKASSRRRLSLYSASAAVIHLDAERNTARRFVVCIQQSMQCIAVKNIRIRMFMYSTLMFVHQVRIMMSSIVVLLNSMEYIILKVWSARLCRRQMAPWKYRLPI